MLPKFKKTRSFLNQYGLEVPLVVLVWGFFFFFWMPAHTSGAELIGAFLISIIPFILPFLLFKLMWEAWYDYKRAKKLSELETCVLEIRLPEEIMQTPYAMELVLRGLYQTGDVDTPVHGFYGHTRPWFSLELVSTEGQVHFYIWTRRRYKTVVETQVYAHYPNVQVVEVPDYTLSVPLDPGAVFLNGIEQTLQKPDPYPILTYIESNIGLDTPGTKEEFKSDPMMSILEMMGTIGKGESLWIQFIIQAHTTCPNSVSTTGEKLRIDEWAEKEIKKIQDAASKRMQTDPESPYTGLVVLTEGDRVAIKAIQTKLNKPPFDVGIRAIYLARHDVEKTSPNMPTAFRAFEHGSEGRGLNGLKPVFWLGPFNFPWHDFMGIRRQMLRQRLYNAYVTRQYFYPPHKHPHIVLNTEELATMYHFPGKVARTPTLQRMPSKRSEAPANLPV